MTRTLAEKIIARAAGRETVRPGEVVTCRVDLAMIHDSGGPRRVQPILDRLGVKVWDPDKVVLVADHYVPAVDAESAAILKLTRDFARDQRISRFHDMRGICHVVLQEHGHLRPGMFAVGGDSHSPSGGAMGAFMMGMGATDMAGVLATGETWIKVPGTHRIHWDGALADGVSAKDMMLYLCREFGLGGAADQVVEYTGPAIGGLSQAERLTLSNMAAELGAQTGLIAPDETTVAALERAGVFPEDGPDGWRQWHGDAGAEYLSDRRHDADRLVPQVAAPHSPANSGPVADHAGQRLDQAYIGACTGAKYEDLAMAARILKGRRVDSGVRLLVAPASTQATERAARDGTLSALTEAGAILMPTGCGACAGYGAGVLAEGEVCLASTSRNFKGRMGAPDSAVFLASPYTVAASAVVGRIIDPRELLP